MIGNDVFWKRFEKSGKIEDYLEYACTTEESLSGAIIGDVEVSDNKIMEPGWDERIQIY